MKIICVVQARMGSERLPGKVIKTILDKPMILYTLDRLSRSKYINQIILATSLNDREKPLVEVVETAGYEVFRGNEHNVLKRYKEAADKYDGDIIIRVTGDCPLIDSVIVDNVVTYFKAYDFDYVRLDVPNTFIRGFDVEVFSKKALDKVFNEYNRFMEVLSEMSEKEKAEIYKYGEHVTYYMYKHPEQFNIGYVKGENYYIRDYRLCVDTKEDFQVVEAIYNHFKDQFVSAKRVIKYLNENEQVSRINIEIKQKNN